MNYVKDLSTFIAYLLTFQYKLLCSVALHAHSLYENMKGTASNTVRDLFFTEYRQPKG